MCLTHPLEQGEDYAAREMALVAWEHNHDLKQMEEDTRTKYHLVGVQMSWEAPSQTVIAQVEMP